MCLHHCLLRSSPSSCLTCRPLQAGNITKSDQILPYFATNELPHGVGEDKGARKVAMRCNKMKPIRLVVLSDFSHSHNIPCTQLAHAQVAGLLIAAVVGSTMSVYSGACRKQGK